MCGSFPIEQRFGFAFPLVPSFLLGQVNNGIELPIHAEVPVESDRFDWQSFVEESHDFSVAALVRRRELTVKTYP